MKQIAEDFIQHLLFNNAHESPSDALKLFAQFIGSWDWRGFDYQDDGSKLPTKGKWIFESVLNGRAIQDVFIFEDPHGNTVQASFAEYGTTIRFPNDHGKTWTAVWISPLNRVVRILEAKEIGAEIVLESKNAKGDLVRWIFSKITGSTFHWRGERSSNGGKAWTLYEELVAQRK